MRYIIEENKRRWLIYAAALIVILLVCWFVWQRAHPPQTVTAISQQQAETPAGVEVAAKNAHIEMLQSQLEEATKQIAELKNRPPEEIVKTVPVEVVKVVEVEREKRGADFAMLTDPKQPDKTVNVKDIEKLPEDTSISLNQYNVFAYKKIIRGINVYPDWGELAQRKFKLDEISVDWSKRVTKDGQYLGVTGAYNFGREQGKIGLRYSF